MFDDCIIMAGGSGTRLWPASNSKRPKQFLSIAAAKPSRTFFSDALERGLAATADAGRVIIIAGKSHVPHIVAACAGFEPAERERMLLMVETEAKNTAPAIAAGAWYTGLRQGEGAAADRAILVLTSDHIIEPLGAFLHDAASAAALARQNKLAVFGIVPSRPETGYGYIEAGEALPGGQEGEAPAYSAASFREKPDRQQAEKFVSAGRFYWNAGIFAFTSSFMLNEFRHHAPLVLAPFEKLTAPGPDAYRVEQGLHILDNWPGFGEAYAQTQAVSIDYAIAEKCESAALIPAHFSWIDIGNWDEYAKLLQSSASEVYSAGTQNCFVDSDIPVALCGVEDLIVTIRSGKDGGPPLALIAKKGETQRVKEIVEHIKGAGRKELL
ncbi:MAG: mannose-1-phosphate guanylyltransferase [Treponema sp.]|jgi:mannose-1-phosphate guanylyltransferase/mannose-6-phosphate isomerase|nr:mannose-1-phosphate guanylyltransferase [Treponema sp.]